MELTASVEGLKLKDYTREHRGRKSLVLWWTWYVLGLPVIFLAAAYLSWGELAFPFKSLPMVFMVSSLYIGILINRHKSNDHRSYKAIGMSIFYSTLGFLIIFSLFAVSRLYFSRTFLLSSYGLVTIWVLAALLLSRRHHPNYLVINGGIADRLKKLGNYGWKFCHTMPESENLSGYDGIVVDLHAQNNEKDLLRSLATASLHNVPIRHAASVLEQYKGQTDLGYIAEKGLYGMSAHRIYPVLKRAGDMLLTLLLSPITIPVAALTALAVKMTSKGPILFTQQRVGQHGNTYTLYKFRSMTTKAEDAGAQFAKKDDVRVTSIGPFIRKFRIDELPQFWNILKGDMSLIGPRPEQEAFVSNFNDDIPFYSYRHKVRPGITGWAQIKDGYAADIESTRIKLQHDLYYIKNLSLSLDLLIIYATVKTICTGFGSR